MSDRLFFGLCAAAAALMILVALAWPQGLGARSPWPFGHPVTVIKAPVKPAKVKPPKVKRPKGPAPGSSL